MMVAALVEALFASNKVRLIFFAALIGLTVSYHAHYTNDFKNTWKKQANFYRQLVLRVPSLQPNTAIIAEGEILYHMGDYPTAYAINTMLARPHGDSGEHANYWFFSITDNFWNRLENFMDGMDIQYRHRSLLFNGKSNESLIVSFDPGKGQCLYVIRPQDSTIRLLPSMIKEASHLSAPGRISPQSSSGLFLQEIGLNYPEDWCTHYQQADLARQVGDWEQVKKLWKDARAKGFIPGAPFEYLPFVEAFARLGEWDQAVSLTLEMKDQPPAVRLTLCDFWDSLPATPEGASALQQIQAELACSAN
jgi:hypothetical protein